MIQSTTVKKIKTKNELLAALKKTTIKELLVIEDTDSRLASSQVARFLQKGTASIVLIRE